MTIEEKIKGALASGDFFGRLADAALARGDYHRSMELNRQAVVAYTRAETLDIELHGEEA